MTSPAITKALDEALDQLRHTDAPLTERLAAYADTLRRLNQPFAQAVDRLVARLARAKAGAGAPKVGDELPDFVLTDDAGRFVARDDLLREGPLVVAFRRGHWCPYCQLSTDELARLQAEAASRYGARLVVISPEREAFTSRLKASTGALFPILSDIDNGYALSIGLAIPVGEEMREFMSKRGRDLAAYQGNDAWVLPIPATFVLDRGGVIAMRHVDPDYRRRAGSREILTALASLPPA